VRGRNLASAPVLAITALTLAAALIFSFSRGAMLSAFAGLVALAILERRSWASHARTAAGALAIALAAPGAAFLAAPEFTSSYLLRFGYTAWRSVGDPLRALDVRADTWARLLETLADHPARLLLGAGYKTLALPSAAGGPLIVDNQWLTALGETGLLGVAALAILIAAILHGSWRAARGASATAALLGAWSFCFWSGQLVHMLFVDLMTYWRVLPVYLAVLALAEREAERRPT
jgi:O-antigen ligase